MGKNISSRNTAHTVDITNRPNPQPVEGGMVSEGEGIPVAYVQRTILTERVNKSINRNNGLDERPSANTSMVNNGAIGKGVRKTGRVA